MMVSRTPYRTTATWSVVSETSTGLGVEQHGHREATIAIVHFVQRTGAVGHAHDFEHVLRPQAVVREPYRPPGHRYTMVRGLVEDGGQLRLVSKIREGRVFIDGPHRVREVGMGSEVLLRRSDEPLTLLGFRRPVGRTR